MNAVTVAVPFNTSFKEPTVPLSRFEPMSISASTLARLLHPFDDQNAQRCFSRITAIQPRLQAERLAAERATVALADAKAEVRRISGITERLINTAINVGRIFELKGIADFQIQDEAWLLTVDGLVSAFRAHGEMGQQFSARFTKVLDDSRRADAELIRATTECARANVAFSNEYRALASAIAFARAVLAELGVEIPRVAPKKKAKAEVTAVSPDRTPMPVTVSEGEVG